MNESLDSDPAGDPLEPLPSGLVTFVMTDIEGSTRLFREQGEAYVGLLETHQTLLRAAFRASHGVEIDTEGDALLVAFADAADALVACLDGERALGAHEWPSGAEVKVRMGVHTGEATPSGSGYVALALHQAARICAGAHGGQILMSEETANAADGRLPSDVSLALLGSFQLRGFPTPARLYQLRHPDLRDDFPPLRALGVVAHNLPFLRASFVGRAEDRRALAALLPTTGVVSIVGPGGVGKTRLSIQVGFDVMEDFPDGAWLVELAPLTDPGAVSRAVATSLRIAEEPGRSMDEVVLADLATKAALLILDNCEHLLDAVAGFAEQLVQQCPRIVVLATSREPLGIEGEAVWRIGALGTVAPGTVATAADAASVDAIRLFTERAALVRPGFELTDDNASDVAAIVAHLNGIPLAIELAAAALSDRSLNGVLTGLTDRFSLLTYGRRTAPARHQTLRAALEWSLDLLGDDERRLFARLAVFSGSSTIEAASAVCGMEPLQGSAIPAMLRRLMRASLVLAAGDTERWSMLESIRELARLELEAVGEAEEVASRHRAWFADRVEAVGDQVGRREHRDVMAELAAEHDNVRRAIDTARSSGDGELGLRLCTAMAQFWMSHGDWTEGIECLQASLSLPGGEERLRGRAMASVGNLLLLRGDTERAEESFDASRRHAMAAGDDVTLARALSGIGYVAFRRSDLHRAGSLWEEALERAEAGGDDRVLAGVLRSLAIAAGAGGHQARAGELLDRAMVSAERAGDDQLLRLLKGSAAEMYLWLGRYEMAEGAYGEALALASAIGDLSARPLLLAELGWVAFLRGDVVSAGRLAAEAAELAEDLGNGRVVASALRLGGESSLRTGDPAEAAARLEAALGVAEGLGVPAEVAGVRCSQATLALEEERDDEAARLAQEAVLLSPLPHPMRSTFPTWILGVVALRHGDLDTAASHFTARLESAEGEEIPRHQADSLWGLGEVAAARGLIVDALRLHRSGLEIRRHIGDRLGVVNSLLAIAQIAVTERPHQAARLVETARALLLRTGAVATRRQATAIEAVEEATGPVEGEAAVTGGGIDEESALAEATRLVSDVEMAARERESHDPAAPSRSRPATGR